GLRDAVERRGPHPWIVAGDEVLEQGADGRRGKMAAHVPLEEPREARRPRIQPRRQLAGALGASAESVEDLRTRLAGEGRTSRRKPYHRGDALGVGRGGVQGQRASQGVPDEDRRLGKPLEHGPDRRILLEDGGRLFSRREPIAAVARQVQHQHTPRDGEKRRREPREGARASAEPVDEDDRRGRSLSRAIVDDHAARARSDLPHRESPRAEEDRGGKDQGLTKRSAKRSLVPRRAPAAPGDESQSRASSGLRRKSPSACSLKPAFCTSSLTNCSSIRWISFAALAPVPGFALESTTMNSPPGFKAAKMAWFILSRSTCMYVTSW